MAGGQIVKIQPQPAASARESSFCQNATVDRGPQDRPQNGPIII
jgi:hypothetical protein